MTDAGREFFERARVLLADLDRAVDATRRTARGEQGQICVGMTPTIAFHPLPARTIRSYRNAFPMVSVALQQARSSELVDDLRRERIDAAFIRSVPTYPEGLVADALLEEPLVVALPVRHKLAQRSDDAEIPVRALAGERFIIQGRQAGLAGYDATIAACHDAGFNPRVGQEVPRIASALSFVAVDLGVCFVPASLRRMHMEGIVYRRLKGRRRPSIPVTLAYRRGEPSPVVRNFLRLAKKAAGDFARADKEY
jgi:DNA-binding transcriptional LysR family regulator